jgi:hypothetical protein
MVHSGKMELRSDYNDPQEHTAGCATDNTPEKHKNMPGVYYLFVRMEGTRNCESKVRWLTYLIAYNKLNNGTEVCLGVKHPSGA